MAHHWPIADATAPAREYGASGHEQIAWLNKVTTSTDGPPVLGVNLDLPLLEELSRWYAVWGISP